MHSNQAENCLLCLYIDFQMVDRVHTFYTQLLLHRTDYHVSELDTQKWRQQLRKYFSTQTWKTD